MPKRNRGARLEWRKERKIWEIIWYERGQRKRLSTGTENRKAADKALAEHIRRSERRSHSRLIDDILADYAEEHAPHTANPAGIGYSILNLEPFFGPLTIDELTKAKCQEYCVWRVQYAKETAKARKFKKELIDNMTVSNDTLRKELNILKAALNHDWQEKRIPAVPYIWMPDPSPPRERWLTRKEAAALLKAARKGPFYLPWFILLSLYSGQRKQAVLKLTWDRVDLERGKVNWQYGRSTNKRRPHQPMPDELKMFLCYLRKYGTEKGYVLHIDGHPIVDIRKSVANAIELSKIERITPHTLKHTAITWMLQSGTDAWSVSGFSGTSVRTIERTYGHHAPDYMEVARTSAKRARQKRRDAAPLTAPRKQKAAS